MEPSTIQTVKRTKKEFPRWEAGTAVVTGDLKMMSPRWLKGTSFTGYGATLTVGIGVAIPILERRSSIYDGAG